MIGAAPMAHIFVTFISFTLGKKLLNENDVEFDLWIGHVLVIFPFLWIINEKSKVPMYWCQRDHSSFKKTFLFDIFMQWHPHKKFIYIDISVLKHILFTKSNDNYNEYLLKHVKSHKTIWNNPTSLRFIAYYVIYKSDKSS